MEKTIVFYHGGCPDGFGGAYAAWKKFGETVDYIPLHRNLEELPDITDADVIFIDFVYDRARMDEIVAQAKSVTVLDHHEGVQEVTQAMPSFVFDNDRSGATIAWDYFHPGVARPTLLSYIEDDDLYRFSLPDTRAVLAYMGVNPFTFEFWDETARILDDAVEGPKLLDRMRAYGEYFVLLAEYAANHAKLVSFEGYECFFATAHPYKPMKSMVGNLLAKKHPPFSLVVSAHPEGYGVSIRGDGSVDVSLIAKKYGGNGHKNSSGFLVSASGPLPWTLLEEV